MCNAPDNLEGIDRYIAYVATILPKKEFIGLLERELNTCHIPENRLKAIRPLATLLGAEWSIDNVLLKEVAGGDSRNRMSQYGVRASQNLNKESERTLDQLIDMTRRKGWTDLAQRRLMKSLPSRSALQGLDKLKWSPHSRSEHILVAVSEGDPKQVIKAGDDAISTLSVALEKSSDHRSLIIHCIGDIASPTGVPLLASVLESSKDDAERISAVKSLIKIPGNEATEELGKIALWSAKQDQKYEAGKTALLGLISRDHEESVKRMCSLTSNGDSEAIRGLITCKVSESFVEKVIFAIMNGLHNHERNLMSGAPQAEAPI